MPWHAPAYSQNSQNSDPPIEASNSKPAPAQVGSTSLPQEDQAALRPQIKHEQHAANHVHYSKLQPRTETPTALTSSSPSKHEADSRDNVMINSRGTSTDHSKHDKEASVQSKHLPRTETPTVLRSSPSKHEADSMDNAMINSRVNSTDQHSIHDKEASHVQSKHQPRTEAPTVLRSSPSKQEADSRDNVIKSRGTSTEHSMHKEGNALARLPSKDHQQPKNSDIGLKEQSRVETSRPVPVNEQDSSKPAKQEDPGDNKGPRGHGTTNIETYHVRKEDLQKDPDQLLKNDSGIASPNAPISINVNVYLPDQRKSVDKNDANAVTTANNSEYKKQNESSSDKCCCSIL